MEQRIARGPIDTATAAGSAKQVLAALAYAHARGIIHRDIKPANIMVTPAGLVKVMDFGIAAGAPARRLTKTGLAVGSLYYMSPEQIRATPVDGRSDIYSLGITLYEMLVGRRPFEGASDFELMKAHLEQQPPPVSAWNPHLPDSLAAAISRAIAKRPEDRFQSAAEFMAAIESFVAAQAHGSGPAAQAPATPAVSRTPTSGYTDPAGWDPMALERVRRELAAYVGPVARVLVSRAAKTTQGLRQLYEVLADEIGSPEDRRKFLANRPLF
jgi:serine/threonine-protein kinase